MPPPNPFGSSLSRPGEGVIDLAVLPPGTPVLARLEFQYPLKLIAPAAVAVESGSFVAHTIFVLTYGGGLVAGDVVALQVRLAEATRLVLLTQGSTKIFKSPSAQTFTRQRIDFSIRRGAALCYLPDPVQPFAQSAFEQTQVYTIHSLDANLLFLDYVCQGRAARGEAWSFYTYASRNEVRLARPDGTSLLLLRDNLILDAADAATDHPLGERMHGVGVYGTLVLHGSLFGALGAFLLAEFRLLPRIGARQWDALVESVEKTAEQVTRQARLLLEAAFDVLWTAAETRGFVVVKIAAKNVDGFKQWLKAVLVAEGTVEREFGERALLCMR